MEHYTHIVSFYGIKCLWAEDTHTLLPIGRIRKLLLEIAILTHDVLSIITSAICPGFEAAYPIKFISEVKMTVIKQQENRSTENQ